MGRDDLLELTESLESDKDHECLAQLLTTGRRGITWWFVKGEVQSKERCEEVVAKLGRLLTNRSRHRLRRHQVDEGLLRVQPRYNESGRKNLFAGRQFDASCPSISNEDAAQFDTASHFTTMLDDV